LISSLAIGVGGGSVLSRVRAKDHEKAKKHSLLIKLSDDLALSVFALGIF
jgi:hypothetical protein